MRQRPIIFSGPMVRAIRAGWKSQTRRILKPQPPLWARTGSALPADPPDDCAALRFRWRPPQGAPTCDWPEQPLPCPYGRPGDQLWVKETWRTDDPGGGLVTYRADVVSGDEPDEAKWNSSLFMPRWASRFALEVVAVRTEPLSALSEDDARAEGVPRDGAPIDCYREIWNRINGSGSWHRDPWVWVVEFRLVQAAGEAAASSMVASSGRGEAATQRKRA